MPTSANYFWLSAIRDFTNIQILDPDITASSAVAGDQIGTLSIEGDKAFLGVKITADVALINSIRLQFQTEDVTLDVVYMGAKSTEMDILFGGIKRFQDGVLDVIALDAISDVSNLTIKAYVSDWSWWQGGGMYPTPTPSPTATPTPTPTPTPA